ncbi:MAG: hypothetical protein SYNGOMJ08_00352 [Candidatus Syntrophoarchaeum sp. GoM_oil]|nr:MAG: hypothetical protein SYNGOMJ08_00352 [Candidatus Syntrophoarchaeum sp. GoM_oil]
MATTIQVSEELAKELKGRKLFDKESYEEIIWDLIEDTQELSEETKKDIEEARFEIARGEYVTLEEAKKELGFR